MPLFRHGALFLSFALLTTLALPQGIGAAASEKKANKSHEAKKKKDREAAKEDGARLTHGVPEPEPGAGVTQPPRPANGSLYSDGAPGGNLFSDFKATSIGDLVFIDVVEESAAIVSSSAKRGRDSGTLGGVVGAVGAVPAPGAAITAGVIGGL